MQTKLTLRLDARLVRRAKAYARRTGKSLSGLVADFFTRLSEPAEAPPEPLSPEVRSLYGALADQRVAEEDYRRYLAEKHR
jgi:hypothetical protein